MTNSLKPKREFFYNIVVERVDVDIILVVLPFDKRFCMLQNRLKAFMGSSCVVFPDQGFHSVVVLPKDEEQHLAFLILARYNIHEPDAGNLRS